MGDHGNGGKREIDGPCGNARVAFTPYHRRREIDGGGSRAIPPLLCDIGSGAADALGVRARSPPCTAMTKPPDTGPTVPCWPGLPCHVRGRRAQPVAEPSDAECGAAEGPAPGHSTDGFGHSGALYPAAGPARPDRLVVHTVWHVLEGGAGSPQLPGRLQTRGRPPAAGSPAWAWRL